MNISNKVIEKISDLAVKGEKFFFIIDFSGENSHVFSPDEAAKNGILFKINEFSNISYELDNELSGNKHVKKEFTVFPVDYNEYHNAFNKVKVALQRGDTYLLNLTFRTRIETGYSLEEIFRLSKARYKLLFKNEFVVFSPEMFISIKDGIIETRPMKGTISASIPEAESKLLTDQKELFEHNTIVDLLRNDLNIVASNVEIEEFRYLERITTNRGEIIQASSIIKGELDSGYRHKLGNIIASLLPAGSVTGAPKEKTVELINRIETYNRGYYTGIFGYYDGNNLETAVSIRFIEKSGDQLFFKSGGGITALSDPNDEYNELIDKVYVPIY
jgi:para-aminobenzoate synthetase component I